MRTRLTDPQDSLWRMILPPTVWAIHFVTVYGLTAVICAKTAAADTARIGIVAASAVALSVIAVSGWRAWRQWDYPEGQDKVHDGKTDQARREFLGHVAFLLAVISAIGVIFATLPAVWIATCR